MKILIVGASGATGRLVVNLLLREQHRVVVVVRENSQFPEDWINHKRLTIIKGNVLEMDHSVAELVKDCHGIVCCLGHNLSWKGLYGEPRRLVRDSVKRLCEAVTRDEPSRPVRPVRPIRFVLMNSVGNANRDLAERRSWMDTAAIALIRILLPPQPDNEQAADYLREVVGQSHPQIQWVAVRPDTLIDQADVSPYTCHPSPTDPIFLGKRKTSRINVADFMKELLTDGSLWDRWRGKMPVIYNEE